MYPVPSNMQPQPAGRMSQEEYWRTKTTPALRFSVLGGGIVCLLMGAITLISLGILGLLDGLLVLGLGYGICWRRSRACAVVAAAYYAIEQLLLRVMPLGIAIGGMSFLTYVFIALLILSIYGTFTFQSRYAAYTASGGGPEQPGDALG